MSKETLLMSIIELVILLLPVLGLIAKFSSWKREMEIKIKFLEANDSKLDAYYQEVLHAIQEINITLARIEERASSLRTYKRKEEIK